MKLIIDIDDKRIKGIKLLAKEQDIATPYPTLEQIIANGIPLDKIRAEIEEQKECRCFDDDDMFVYITGLNDAIYIIDKYKAESEDKE